jgi:hypothetical protein
MNEIKAYVLLSAGGPILVLTTYDIKKPQLLERLAAKTVSKFIAFEVAIDAIKDNYSAHFSHTLKDPLKTGDIKILDDDGIQVFSNLKFKYLISGPFYYDP